MSYKEVNVGGVKGIAVPFQDGLTKIVLEDGRVLFGKPVPSANKSIDGSKLSHLLLRRFA